MNSRTGVAMQTSKETIMMMMKQEHFLFLAFLSSALAFLEIEIDLASKCQNGTKSPREENIDSENLILPFLHFNLFNIQRVLYFERTTGEQF